jgi:hypothetical protein
MAAEISPPAEERAMANRTRRTLRALTVAMTAAVAVAVPATARAATVTSLDCDSGGARYVCDVTVVGPSYAPALIRWTVNGAPVPAYNNQVVVGGACRVGRWVTISVWVGDPLHEQGEPYEEDTESASLLCRQLWQ